MQRLTVPVLDVPDLDLGVRQVTLPVMTPLRPVLAALRPVVSPPAVPVPPVVPDAPGVPGVPGVPAPLAVPTSPAPQAVQAVQAVPSPPAWFRVEAKAEPADRERMRAVLGWRYQAHSRTVARAQALHPGLRNAASRPGVAIGLVAVLALLDGFGTRVDEALRRADTPDEDVLLLARCACVGLAHLPAIGGPVFATAPTGWDGVGDYRIGDSVVEPGFLAAAPYGLGAAGGDAGAVRYAIWSATARRLDRLRTPSETAAGGETAMFRAGTRFTVLGVDVAGGVDVDGGVDVAGADAGGPGHGPVVLLREQIGGTRNPDLDERVIGKLRTALVAAAGAGSARPRTMPWPLGMTAENRRFAARTAGEGENP